MCCERENSANEMFRKFQKRPSEQGLRNQPLQKGCLWLLQGWCSNIANLTLARAIPKQHGQNCPMRIVQGAKCCWAFLNNLFKKDSRKQPSLRTLPHSARAAEDVSCTAAS